MLTQFDKAIDYTEPVLEPTGSKQHPALDDYLPVFEFHEYHQVDIAASPSEVYQAIKALKMSDIPVAKFLLQVRNLPGSLKGRKLALTADEKPMLEQLIKEDFVMLADKLDNEIVFGMIGQPWKLDTKDSPKIKDADSFLAFAEPGYARVGTNMLINPCREGVRLSTETRISIPDREAHRKFAFYWRIIHLGSALIRRMWLNAIKKRAEEIARTPVVNPND